MFCVALAYLTQPGCVAHITVLSNEKILKECQNLPLV